MQIEYMEIKMIKCAHCKHKQIVTEQTHKKVEKKNGSIFYVPKIKEKDVMDIVQYHFENGIYVICEECECLLEI